MVIQFENLQYTLYRAENAQAIQNLFLNQARAAQEAGAVQSQNVAKADQVQVHDTVRPEGTRIREEEGRRQPFEGESSSSSEGEKSRTEEKTPSPNGKGKIIDVEA